MRRLGWVETGTPAKASIELVTLTYDDGAPGERSELYQLPLAFYAERQERLNHAFVGWWEEPELGGYVHAYDAVHDRDAMAGWLRAFDEQPVRRTPRVPPAAGARPRHRGPLDAVLRRAVQLLAGLR